MHTVKVLHKLLSQSVPSIHSVRRNAFTAAILALTKSAKAFITSLGRHLDGKAYDKHKIKRMDRLLSNKYLYKERHPIYTVLMQYVLKCVPEPVIAIDWSPLCADQSWHYCVRLFQWAGAILLCMKKFTLNLNSVIEKFSINF